MNKTELIDHIAASADISKAAATRSLEAVIGAVKTTLKKNGTVTLVGFGTFSVSKRAARAGRNPQTGDVIKIKAAKVPKFKPGKGLKDAVNSPTGMVTHAGKLVGKKRQYSAVGFHEIVRQNKVKARAGCGCLAQLVERRPYKA